MCCIWTVKHGHVLYCWYKVCFLIFMLLWRFRKASYVFEWDFSMDCSYKCFLFCISTGLPGRTSSPNAQCKSQFHYMMADLDCLIKILDHRGFVECFKNTAMLSYLLFVPLWLVLSNSLLIYVSWKSDSEYQPRLCMCKLGCRSFRNCI